LKLNLHTTRITIVSTILVVGLICSSVYGQEEVTGLDEWQVEVSPYFWMPSLDFDATVAGATVHLDMDFGEVLDNFDLFGFSGRIEAWKGKWGLLFDGQYVDVDGDFKLTTPGPGLGVGGVDQTALLLLGEEHGRRNYMFHYSGDVLGAIRYEDFKIHIKKGHGGLPGMDFYNVMRDPCEKFGELYPGLFAVTPVQNILRDHLMMIKKFPHRKSEMPKGAEITPHD
jgi:hypothetical protein